LPALCLYKFRRVRELTRKFLFPARAWPRKGDMDNDPRTEIFLARALEAVEMAAAARGPVARAQWLIIAETYRDLAEPEPLEPQKREVR